MQKDTTAVMSLAKVEPYAILDNDMIIGQEREYCLRVKDLADEERPREKLLKKGVSLLSVAELLAIVLATGTRKEEVLRMSNRITNEYGEKGVAYQNDPKKLARELDIPESKACQIVASFELGRRFFTDSKNGQRIIRTPRQVFEYFKDMRDLPKEQLRGIYLNSHYKVIHDEIISIGTLTSNVVHPREVFRPAISCAAAAVIIVHNHPSGSIKPTESDIIVTRQLVQVGKIIGINILDHVIIAGNKYASIHVTY